MPASKKIWSRIQVLPKPRGAPMLGVPVCRTEPEESIPKTIRHDTNGHCLNKSFLGVKGAEWNQKYLWAPFGAPLEKLGGYQLF
jgi:hypothetical protein